MPTRNDTHAVSPTVKHANRLVIVLTHYKPRLDELEDERRCRTKVLDGDSGTEVRRSEVLDDGSRRRCGSRRRFSAQVRFSTTVLDARRARRRAVASIRGRWTMAGLGSSPARGRDTWDFRGKSCHRIACPVDRASARFLLFCSAFIVWRSTWLAESSRRRRNVPHSRISAPRTGRK